MPPLRATSPRGQQPPGNLPSHGSTSGPSTRQGTPPSSTQSRLGRGVATTGAVWGRRVSRVPTAAARWVCRPWQAGRPPQPRAPDTRKGEHRGESLAELGAPRGPCCPTAGSVAPPPPHTPPRPRAPTPPPQPPQSSDLQPDSVACPCWEPLHLQGPCVGERRSI